MKIYKEVTVAHLKGDLTQSGVIYSIINLLAGSLQKIVSGGYKKIRVDCRMIGKADIGGLQLLKAWTQSARIRGVETELINLSRSQRQAMKRMGFDNCFKIISDYEDTPEFIKRRTNVYIERDRRGALCLSM